MYEAVRSIRTFIGSSNYNLSRSFYRDFGFEELQTSPDMSYFHIDSFGFYLQDYYVPDWINNTMVFLEVEKVQESHNRILSLNLMETYENVRISEIRYNDWGNEFFVHDPSGILWHIGTFH